MTTADLAAVLEIERDLFPKDAWSRNLFEGELAGSSRLYVVVEVDDQVVGYAGLLVAVDQADVQTIAVRRDHQGRGIGRALLTALLEEAVRRRVRTTFLEVRADNPRARDLYERYGFAEIGVRRRYYDDGGDAIVMSKDLQHG